MHDYAAKNIADTAILIYKTFLTGRQVLEEPPTTEVCWPACKEQYIITININIIITRPKPAIGHILARGN